MLTADDVTAVEEVNRRAVEWLPAPRAVREAHAALTQAMSRYVRALDGSDPPRIDDAAELVRECVEALRAELGPREAPRG